ncbi:MAG: hypothetical protein DRN66_01225 [Candidatus Nanohalarchaeota archaeon]|nr:MAG: hypothetical protein DRN66_01225 [Candidatus Nanohaloarchaeota archaeon]
MEKTKSKGMVGFVILVAIPVVFLICFLLMYIAYVIGMTNAANTSEYVENVTHSTMLDFTMLNANYITQGTFPSTTRACAKKTLLPLKNIIGIGLSQSAPASYDVGYHGSETINLDLKLNCIELYLNSLGYKLGNTGGFSFTPSDYVLRNGPVNLYVIYPGIGCTDDKCYSTIWPPKNPKITYAYIALPNEKVSTVVIKTN